MLFKEFFIVFQLVNCFAILALRAAVVAYILMSIDFKSGELFIAVNAKFGTILTITEVLIVSITIEALIIDVLEANLKPATILTFDHGIIVKNL